ncbi:hypothetical protein G5714_023675 [Onychostoma macrolepis]|uniref:BEN domain-containing protein n=2 Tax=Onychostoma macrolepis TaxID=369639 RepID=A0A7J6BQZ8_9TELE|nr:hypothetical protein G5714_023675 [Onychostoma macrolepis]
MVIPSVKKLNPPVGRLRRYALLLACFLCASSCLVKIGNDGTVTVSSHCWETAKASTTPNGMARVLLMGLFSVDILLKSNLKGGVSKLDPCADRRKALDPRKLQALLDTVVNQFPTAKEADVRKSINGRICELRHQLKSKSVLV